ncbi:uncharacterized protein LOC125507319 [Triticum urartu]|uniref:uncharacterized protein LOC125507319 n=1 Tax=Triticum urartu TaxID=4572 RepID=UPI002043A9F4|nr:uncharacterized protein LOC125507319 [Triticum urartu]
MSQSAQQPSLFPPAVPDESNTRTAEPDAPARQPDGAKLKAAATAAAACGTVELASLTYDRVNYAHGMAGDLSSVHWKCHQMHNWWWQASVYPGLCLQMAGSAPRSSRMDVATYLIQIITLLPLLEPGVEVGILHLVGPQSQARDGHGFSASELSWMPVQCTSLLNTMSIPWSVVCSSSNVHTLLSTTPVQQQPENNGELILRYVKKGWEDQIKDPGSYWKFNDRRGAVDASYEQVRPRSGLQLKEAIR